MELAGQAVSPVEAVAFVTGLASVWYAQRLNIATWPTGIVSVLCFAWVFFHAKLYADAGLQLVFCVLCGWGWWKWRQGQGREGVIRVSRAPMRELVLGLVAAMLATAACAWLLRTHSDSPVPWPDAVIFSFSLLATWKQARGWIDCWWVWIAVDIVSVPLYWSRSLPLTAVLYVLFLGLCVAGWRHWSRRIAAQEAA
ncbi:nicotinamide riboside transporter PnuC [Ramlibacter albus]|uniref:Nicotinamide riboside transporter PnuC n=1 Tax=Ramlibacter albus TaxID=2079448 RepID=A0A923S121_9BURK|nr:nicotinamide riboside transporter PnuC [Ramlibacter albus]MBC5763821.1 nicotinamide mononucleotide transporter [Ramlibacter albus]